MFSVAIRPSTEQGEIAPLPLAAGKKSQLLHTADTIAGIRAVQIVALATALLVGACGGDGE
jgi:hypothetical protein